MTELNLILYLIDWLSVWYKNTGRAFPGNKLRDLYILYTSDVIVFVLCLENSHIDYLTVSGPMTYVKWRPTASSWICAYEIFICPHTNICRTVRNWKKRNRNRRWQFSSTHTHTHIRTLRHSHTHKFRFHFACTNFAKGIKSCANSLLLVYPVNYERCCIFITFYLHLWISFVIIL